VFAGDFIVNPANGKSSTTASGIVLFSVQTVVSFVVISGGSSYTTGSLVTVTFGSGCSTDPIAYVYPSSSTIVASDIYLQSGGLGCNQTPTVTLSGGGGSGAVVYAVMSNAGGAGKVTFSAPAGIDMTGVRGSIATHS
jgi:hypothetical protein